MLRSVQHPYSCPLSPNPHQVGEDQPHPYGLGNHAPFPQVFMHPEEDRHQALSLQLFPWCYGPVTAANPFDVST